MVITDPLVTKPVGTGSSQRAGWEKDVWHLPVVASDEKQLGSDWEVPLQGNRASPGAGSTPTSWLCPNAACTCIPTTLLTACGALHQHPQLEMHPQLGSSWLPLGDNISRLPHVASKTTAGGGRKGAVFLPEILRM